ncbi:ImpA family type VI secretion system protein [Erwinia amylovora]
MNSNSNDMNYFNMLTTPFPGEKPCGENLEYDGNFILLQTRLQPKLNAEYGSFVEAATPLNWAEIERDCLSLLQKSKDIRLIIILIRCRLRITGLASLSEGLTAILSLLETYPDQLYPQLLDEGEYDPLMRANAFAELINNDGILADLRSITLPPAGGMSVTIRDIENTHRFPHDKNALSTAQISTLQSEWTGSKEMRAIGSACNLLNDLQKSLSNTLGDFAPDLSAIEYILQIFTFSDQAETDSAGNADAGTHISPLPLLPNSALNPENCSTPAQINIAVSETLNIPSVSAIKSIQSRSEALLQLRDIHAWFLDAEPGNPIIFLLDIAEKMAGKSYAELINFFTPEIISQLTIEKG